ncbi:MAG: succinate dehydrogenase, hydrophobic membrane anchor protein [Candidatus Marinimicrobia bacterium]|nr:succinate dehydrogenase, hydrophobic membrane anchor protein [Candidatus Neomarinimicrobiota bacterium]
MARKKHSPEKLRWVFQRVSAIPLAVCIIVNVWIFSFKFEQPLRYEQINQLFARPEWILFYSLFILLAVLHGLSGLWTVMTDHNPSAIFKKNLKIILIAAGTVLVIFSEWTIIVLGR